MSETMAATPPALGTSTRLAIVAAGTVTFGYALDAPGSLWSDGEAVKFLALVALLAATGMLMVSGFVNAVAWALAGVWQPRPWLVTAAVLLMAALGTLYVVAKVQEDQPPRRTIHHGPLTPM